MNILFITNPHEDYLADSLLHGFRKLYGELCVDYPKCEILYSNCPENIKKTVRGNGFTLYSGLLEDIEIDRFNITNKIKNSFFDLIIFSNIQRQFGLFTQYRPWLTKNNTIIIDGEDTTEPYPARGYWWRRSYYWNLPNAHKDFLYFKREWTPKTRFNIWMRLLPNFLRVMFPQSKNLRIVNFSFPEEKIIKELPNKKKEFPVHIVDKEVAESVEGSASNYAFKSEKDYYRDLQSSKFGITLKRGGWDCLRHYEIAANGAVICFRNLNKKPSTCAPHGLSKLNSIGYSDKNDLMNKIKSLSDFEYLEMQKQSLNWIKQNSTVAMAKRVILEFTKNASQL